MSVVCRYSIRLLGSGCCRVTWCEGGDLAMCISSSRRLVQAFHMAGLSSKKTSKKRKDS